MGGTYTYNDFGGIVGGGGSVTRCYNAYNLSGNDVYGFIKTYGLPGTDVYYLYEGNEDLDNGAKTYEELCHQATYTNFDFTNIWKIDEDKRFPVLKDVPFEYVTGISLDQASVEIAKGSYAIITPTVTSDNASSKTVIWTSSDKNVVEIKNGDFLPQETSKKVLLAHSAGFAIITAKALDGGWVATCAVTVSTPVTDVNITEASLELGVGEMHMLTATVSTDDEITWTSDYESVATVDSNGNVTAVSPGIVTITATADGVSDTCEVTVVPAAIQSPRYTIDKLDGMLKGVTEDTTVAALKANLDNESDLVKIYDSGGQEVTAGVVGTGMTVEYRIGGALKDSLKILVLGDINGDGRINVADYTLLRLNIMGIKDLSGLYAAAGDVSRDGGLNVSDYTLIKLDLLNIQKIN
jgi:hypothetical protein